MNYNQKVSDAQAKAYEKVVATKILDLMANMRLSNDENVKRRWVWELLQNAKDVCYPDSKVSVEIVLTQQGETGVVEFKHNGKPFSTKDVTFLIEQISTKDRLENDKHPKTTGKFGTGFLTTHLLSEKVEVHGIVEEPELEPREFDLLLDRSGKTIDDIILSVKNSMESLRNLDISPVKKYKSSNFNTVFRYHLDKEGIEVAKKGIEDLHSALPFTLAFLSDIKSVVVKSNGEIISYRRSDTVQNISDKIKLVSIETSSSQKIIIALLSSQSTSIAVEVTLQNQQIGIEKFNDRTPRLFCNFPLIGTEDFYFPVAINNSSFHPNEPRSGIYLTDKEAPEIFVNKRIIQEARELYNHLLDYAAQNNWQNLYVLSSVSLPKSKKDWLSEQWFKNSVQKQIQEKLKVTSVVDTVDHGRVTINEAVFPYHKDEEVRDGIWKLFCNADIFKLPIKEHLNGWYFVVKQSEFSSRHLTLGMVTDWIAKQKTLANLAELLKRSEKDAIGWLNQYYSLANQDEGVLALINQDKLAVIPNQKGVFCSKSNLFIDEGIEEELKNAIKLLRENWRDFLLLAGIYTGDGVRYPVKSQNDIVQKINQLLDEKEEIADACDHLISCFSDAPNFPSKREDIYNFCKDIFPEDVPERRQIKIWDDSIWKKVDGYQVECLVNSVAEQESIDGLDLYLDKKGALEWLHKFVDFLERERYSSLLNQYAILPNQNGQFKKKDELSLDDEIDNELKDIVADLGKDFREELLHRDIYLKLPKQREKSSKDIAQEIESLVGDKFSEVPRSEETKKIFGVLFLWLTDHEEQAKELFPTLCSDSKYRLLDDKDIAHHMEKVPILLEENQELRKENQELREENEHLKSEMAKSKKPVADFKKEITQEVLIIHGIDSEEKLGYFLEENSYFVPPSGHKGGNGFSMIMHVKGIIERAKRNVRDYLTQHPDYDCSVWDERDTVIYGVKKYGHPIHLVVRPSDGRKVVFYHESEQDTLKLPDSELWVEDGRTPPREITLGTVLEKEGISQINL